jgi:hypothetical protein
MQIIVKIHFFRGKESLFLLEGRGLCKNRRVVNRQRVRMMKGKLTKLSDTTRNKLCRIFSNAPMLYFWTTRLIPSETELQFPSCFAFGFVCTDPATEEANTSCGLPRRFPPNPGRTQFSGYYVIAPLILHESAALAALFMTYRGKHVRRDVT